MENRRSLNPLNVIGRCSVRKPLAWLCILFIIFVVCYYMAMGEDIPKNMTGLLVWVIGIPVSVVGSSSYEAVRLPQREASTRDEPDSEE
jgi:hypothetical protein